MTTIRNEQRKLIQIRLVWAGAAARHLPCLYLSDCGGRDGDDNDSDDDDANHHTDDPHSAAPPNCFSHLAELIARFNIQLGPNCSHKALLCLRNLPALVTLLASSGVLIAELNQLSCTRAPTTAQVTQTIDRCHLVWLAFQSNRSTAHWNANQRPLTRRDDSACRLEEEWQWPSSPGQPAANSSA